MGVSSRDAPPFSQTLTKLSDLAETERKSNEKTLTKSERARIHLRLIDEAEKGLADVKAGYTRDAKAALQMIKRRRAADAQARGVVSKSALLVQISRI